MALAFTTLTRSLSSAYTKKPSTLCCYNVLVKASGAGLLLWDIRQKKKALNRASTTIVTTMKIIAQQHSLGKHATQIALCWVHIMCLPVGSTAASTAVSHNGDRWLEELLKHVLSCCTDQPFAQKAQTTACPRRLTVRSKSTDYSMSTAISYGF